MRAPVCIILMPLASSVGDHHPRAGRPVAVADSFGNWSWTLTCTGSEISGINDWT